MLTRSLQDTLTTLDGTPASFRLGAVVGVWVAIVLAAVNMRSIQNDNVPNVLIPLSVLRDGDCELSEFLPVLEEAPPGQRYWAVSAPAGLYSKYPIWTGIFAAPLFAPFAGWDARLTDQRLWLAVGRIVALVMSGIFAGVLTVTLRRFMPSRWAVFVTMCVIFGSVMWHHLGGHLTNQVLPNLCLAVLLWILTRERMTALSAALAGTVAGLAFAARLPVVFVAVMPLGIFASRREWRRLIPYVFAGSLIFPVLTLVYNHRAFGHALRTGYAFSPTDSFTANMVSGAAGLLISPTCGLLFYTPFVVVCLWVGWNCIRRRLEPQRNQLGVWLLLGVIGHWMLFSRWWCWRGGLSFGSRMMIETLPLLAVLLALGWPRLCRPKVRRVLVVTGWLAIAHHLVGTIVYDMTATANPLKSDWDWSADFIALFLRQYGPGRLVVEILRQGALFTGTLLLGGYLAGRLLIPNEGAADISCPPAAAPASAER